MLRRRLMRFLVVASSHQGMSGNIGMAAYTVSPSVAIWYVLLHGLRHAHDGVLLVAHVIPVERSQGQSWKGRCIQGLRRVPHQVPVIALRYHGVASTGKSQIQNYLDIWKL